MDSINWDPIANPSRLEEPLQLKEPKRILVCPYGDLFHENVTGKTINEVWMTMINAKWHTFMIATKSLAKLLWWTKTAAEAKQWPVDEVWPDHIYLGTVVERQFDVFQRLPMLLQIPAAVRFVNVEPLLEPIELTPYLGEEYWWCPTCEAEIDSTRVTYDEKHDSCGDFVEVRGGINWVICSGQKGLEAKPIHPHWVQSLRNQCVNAGVPFFFKDWGNWIPYSQCPECKNVTRLLDGREWDEYPEDK